MATKLFVMCCILMSCMFGYSAFVQLNDPDRYLWFPLYAFACTLNLLNWAISSKTRIWYAAIVALFLGASLFIKVVIEDFVSGRAGLCSLDFTERVVREKIGSGLVVISMILHQNRKISRFIDVGMAVLVGFSYGLPFIFFVVEKGEIKL